MAQALIAGLRACGRSADELLVADVSSDARAACAAMLSPASIFPSIQEMLTCPVAALVLAVKPQDIGGVLEDLARLGPHRRPRLVLSIAAGITIRRIEDALPWSAPVVRAMPNTPALVRRGITVLSPGTHAGPREREVARMIFSAVGRVVELPEEKLDAVTAVSGSGPAYFFLFIDALIEAGVREGLERSVAETLALETASGSVQLAQNRLAGGTSNLQDLIAGVASKGGTTEAALRAFSAAGFGEVVVRAVAAAAERSRELGRKERA